MLEIQSSSLSFRVFGNWIEGQETITDICSILKTALVPADREDLIWGRIEEIPACDK